MSSRSGAPGGGGSPAGLPRGFEVLVPGEFGGKARGLLRAAGMLQAGVPLAGIHTPRLRIPDSALVGTDLFDGVVEENGLAGTIRAGPPPGDGRAVYESFLRCRLPAAPREALRAWLAGVTSPLVVRSSSVQEDDPRHSFSGIYRTHFVPNAGSLDERQEGLERALRVVLGSTFLPRAYAYRRHCGLRAHDDRMAVLLQPVVGRRRGDLFHPLLAGVGFSRNVYPWTERISVEDGVVRLVYGLGTRAVGREYARVFVPTAPRLRPEGHAVEDMRRYAQERFDALDLAARSFRQGIPVKEVLGTAGNDLHLVSSLIREGDFLREVGVPLAPGDPFLLTFQEILDGRTALPLVPMIRALFESLSRGFGGPVDIEFACDSAAEEEEPRDGAVHLVQVRPLGVREAHRQVRVTPGAGRVLLRSRHVLGNGEVEGIRRAILVLPGEYLPASSGETIREILRLRRLLDGEPYLLVGPGRWGTSNPALGVPADYEAIAGCAAIVEVASGAMAPEVSYGTHFFGEMLRSGVLYLAVLPGGEDRLDEEHLRSVSGRPRHGVRLAEFPDPVVLQVDGLAREGLAFVRSPPGRGTGPPRTAS